MDPTSSTKALPWKKRYPRSPPPRNLLLLLKRQNPNKSFPRNSPTTPQSSPKKPPIMSHRPDHMTTRSTWTTPSPPRLEKSIPYLRKNRKPPRTSFKKTSTVEKFTPQTLFKPSHSSLSRRKTVVFTLVKTTAIFTNIPAETPTHSCLSLISLTSSKTPNYSPSLTSAGDTTMFTSKMATSGRPSSSHIKASLNQP